MATIVIPNKELVSPEDADYKEIARYLGYRKVNPPEENVSKLIKECAEEMYKVLLPKACFEVFPLELKSENQIEFGGICFSSVDLTRNLNNCSSVYIFSATIGPQVDSLIRRYEKFDTVKAAILQSTGAMYIEKIVDLVNEQIKKESKEKQCICHPRFSPGYGDVSLEIQKDFFRLLPCDKIGLTLMDTLIMAPEKSVTAFVGVEKNM